MGDALEKYFGELTYPDSGVARKFPQISDPTKVPNCATTEMVDYAYQNFWWQQDYLGIPRTLGASPATGGIADQIAFWKNPGQFEGTDDFVFNYTNGLKGNEAGVATLDFQWGTQHNQQAIFLDASADTVNFGSLNIPGADFVSGYYLADNDDASARPFKLWSFGHQTADANDWHVTFEARAFYDVDNGVHGTGVIMAGEFINVVDADTSAGRVFAIETVHAETGHYNNAHTPTTDYATAFQAICKNESGTVTDMKAYRAHGEAGAGTTTLYQAYVAEDAIGDEAIAFRATNDLSQVWAWKDLGQITGSQTDYAIGDGYNISINTDAGGYTIDGITHGVVANRDGRCVQVYNAGAFSVSILGYGAGGTGAAAAVGNKVFSTTGGDLTLPAGAMLELKYKQTLDTNNGGWIAYVV